MSPTRKQLAEAIALWRESVIDSDIALEDACEDLRRALERLASCRRDRDRAALHLAHLLALADEEPDTSPEVGS